MPGRFNSAREHGTVGAESLAGDDQAELIETSEGGQVGASEARLRGSVRHVEVFRMGSVRTSILGRPRRLPQDLRAPTTSHACYTLNCEEPSKGMHPYPRFRFDSREFGSQ